ncbi:molybdopterin molybdenumtransferase MoeA [Solitalea longa]|uniref:Molybdopterin molybdenumtransferase n=1 Tax=Solitalea longa TaxID=2079460 RepID=A0A2S5A152_9SPHI|nr:molybdopterin molybdotransferase MoeA [Solitalea longa]POY36320.1 molybdopterin molybdenumtransferase MoeA [Solitalea longa]
MLSVSEAFNIVLETVVDFGTEHVEITQANGRILRESIIADRPFPPFDRVTMDGIAISFSDYERGKKVFNIEALQAAGMPAKTLRNGCIEVMTGAILPENTDTIIPYEDISRQENSFVIDKPIKKGQNIHLKGSDVVIDAIMLLPGIKITAAEIAVLATVGKTKALVSRLPKVALVATGDELVQIDQTPLPHQLRMSNVFAMHSLLLNLGVNASIHHLIDEKEVLQKSFTELFASNDMIICSGGVSAGKFDYIPEVLKGLGVETRFHKVKQRPGKPLLFGVSAQKVPFFGLPGNPVSGFMCMCRYVLPWIKKSMKMNLEKPTHAILNIDFKFDKPLTFFLPVKTETSNDGYLLADPAATNGSGDFATLTSANAFMELPEDKDEFKAGEVYSVWFYK